MSNINIFVRSYHYFSPLRDIIQAVFIGPVFAVLISCSTVDRENQFLTYDGKNIFTSDFSTEDQLRIFEDQQRLHNTLTSVSSKYIVNRFLKEYAAEHKITVSEARTKLSPPPGQSEESTVEYYNKIKHSIPYSYEQVKDELKKIMSDEYDDRTNDLILNLAYWSKGTKLTLTPPVAPVLSIATEGFAFKGASQPKVTLVEFGDFTCPYCKKVSPILEQLAKEYKSDLKIVWKYFFSHSGEIPEQLAVGAHCLIADDLFWKYHDYVFENQMEVLFKNPQEILKSAGIPQPSTYSKCLEDKTVLKTIRESHSHAAGLGVKSTPTLFVNGRRYDVQLTYEAIQKVIENELRLAGSRSVAR